ncbi:MAG TPA: hypothetical protein VLO07_09255, partial [Thermoanaerobaculia bacterium]|nr:hypothetical protein [Thermoanaerobaculia bacterium]
PLLTGCWDVPPPILWDLTVPSRWALMEGDVTISHAMRVEALVGLEGKGVAVTSVIRMPGHIPWGYEVKVNNEVLKLSGNVVRDVVYWHQTIQSAGQMLLESVAKAIAAIA